MNTPDPQLAAAEEEKHRAVLCSKCEHLNPYGLNECKRCGARLFIACNDCGTRNERVRTKCRKCGRRMHRPVAERIAGRVHLKKLGITPGLVILFIIAMFVAMMLIKYFSGLSSVPE